MMMMMMMMVVVVHKASLSELRSICPLLERKISVSGENVWSSEQVVNKLTVDDFTVCPPCFDLPNRIGQVIDVKPIDST